MPHSEPTEQTPADPQKFYLTTPIYYVNARPHIGHAYTTIVADVLARRHRLLGHPTFFLTGTDEHGQKIERSAAAAGVPPQQFADQVSQSFRDLWDRMGLTYDRYIRTTSDPHKQGAQALFAELFRLGHIYLSSYTGSYCVSDEAFVDLPPSTPCPDCGRPLETVTEENFFFRLSAFQLPLLDLIESNTLRITPEASRNEVLSFLRGPVTTFLLTALAESGENFKRLIRSGEVALSQGGQPYLPGALKDLSVSRSSFTWGIPVPQPAASLTQDPQVIYVWLDALANYMTAIGYGDPTPEAKAEFQKWWPANLHLVGKEITRFHCIYWPAFLLALNPATAPSEAVILSEAKDPRISSLPQATPEPEGAPSTAQLHRASGGNVNPPPAPTWATPQAEWSPEEHGLPPEAHPLDPTQNPVILSEAQSAHSKDLRSAPAQLPPEAHAAWAQLWLPKQITANGWLLFDNSKMSKSKGNVVRTETILDAFGTLCPPKPSTSDEPSTPTSHERDLFAADVLRYYLLREIPFGQDGSFTFEALVTRYNADLANGYGNLVSRVLKMMQQYFAGEVLSEGESDWTEKDWTDHAFSQSPAAFQWSGPDESEESQEPRFSMYQALEHVLRTRDLVNRKYGDVRFQAQLAEIALAIRMIDGFISKEAPWKLARSETSKSWLVEVLYTAAEAIRILTALLHPILPHATASVWSQLGLGSIESAAKNGDLRNLQWGGLQPGTKLGPLGPIFPRIYEKDIPSFIETMTNMEISNTPALTPITDNNDRTHPDQSPFPEAPLTSAAATTPVLPSALTDELAGTTTPTRSFDPAAGPRPLSPANPAATVAGSHAITTERSGTPSHTEANPSGIFAGGPPPVAPTLSAHSSQPTAHSSSSTAPDQSPEITIDDFTKIDLRVAQILVCERIPKADKLLRLEVDLGPELGRRQILSGIAEHYSPESLIGRRIVVIANLAPRKMRGLESHGMLLAATDPSTGKPILATMAEDTPPGARLK